MIPRTAFVKEFSAKSQQAILIQVMASCCHAESHHPNCWPSSMMVYGIFMPQWDCESSWMDILAKITILIVWNINTVCFTLISTYNDCLHNHLPLFQHQLVHNGLRNQLRGFVTMQSSLWDQRPVILVCISPFSICPTTSIIAALLLAVATAIFTGEWGSKEMNGTSIWMLTKI